MALRRACKVPMAVTVELLHEGLRYGTPYPRNEDHTESDNETVVAYAVRLHLEDPPPLQTNQTRYNTATRQPTAITEDSPTSGLEGDHMKLVSYAMAVSSLMYAMVATRPDIAHAVVIVSRFMHNPGRAHWNVVKHISRYLVGHKTTTSHLHWMNP